MSKMEENFNKFWKELTETIVYNCKAELEQIGDEIIWDYREQHINISITDGKPRIICSDLAHELLSDNICPDFEIHDFEDLLKEVMNEKHDPKDLFKFAELLGKYANIAKDIANDTGLHEK